MEIDHLLPDSYFGELFEGVYLVDKNRTILYWNHAAEMLTGYTAAEVIGTSCFDDLLMHVDKEGNNLCKTACPLDKTISDGQSRELFVSLRHKDGHRVPVHIRAVPFRDKNGIIDCTMEFFTKSQ